MSFKQQLQTSGIALEALPGLHMATQSTKLTEDVTPDATDSVIMSRVPQGRGSFATESLT